MPVTSLRISSRVKPTASWAATLAIGNPVALEARAEERDTRGFISITTRRPVRGSTANWTLAPPVSTPTARSTVRASSRISWYSRSDRVIWGATVTESPVWTPIGSTFSIEQTTTALSARSRITSSSNSFQPSTDSSIRTRPTGLAVRPSPSSRSSSPVVRAMPPPQPPRVNEGRRTTGSPSVAGGGQALVDRADLDPAGQVEPGRPAGLGELDPRLGPAHGVDGGPDELDPEPLQGAVLVQGHGQVEGGLPAEGGQQGVGPLGLEHGRHRAGGERLQVGGVGHLGVGHDRGRVGVDQHDPQPQPPQGPAGLGARVVELGRLPDDDRPRPDDQDGAQVLAQRH